MGGGGGRQKKERQLGSESRSSHGSELTRQDQREEDKAYRVDRLDSLLLRKGLLLAMTKDPQMEDLSSKNRWNLFSRSCCF